MDTRTAPVFCIRQARARKDHPRFCIGAADVSHASTRSSLSASISSMTASVHVPPIQAPSQVARGWMSSYICSALSTLGITAVVPCMGRGCGCYRTIRCCRAESASVNEFERSPEVRGRERGKRARADQWHSGPGLGAWSPLLTVLRTDFI